MVSKKFLSLILFLFSVAAFGQADPTSSQNVEMADKFYSEGKVYIVVVVVSIVVVGMVAYLFLLDRKLSRLEKEMKK
jgi:CcmD family protein